MGFRFFNLNPIYKSALSNLTSQVPRHSSHYPSSLNPLPIQSLAAHLLDSPPISPGDPSGRIFRRWHFGHSHGGNGHHHLPGPSGSKESEKIFRLGLASDIGLSAGKAITGYLTGSTAIVADAAHSVSDVVLSGVALVSFKAARAPKDKEHPYGHGKFESLGALGISCMLLVTAGGIAWHAVDMLMNLLTTAPDNVGSSLAHNHNHHHGVHQHKIDMEHPVLAVNMTIISIAIKEGLYWITKRAGEREGSGLMKANAWHHRADAVSSLVALIGVGGSILGIRFLDPLAGLVVSGMILKAGVESGYQSILELVDAATPQQTLEPHRQTILQVDGVKGCHRLRGRRAGSFLYLDVHIEVDPFTSVSAAHHVGEIVRRRLHENHSEVSEVFIHIDPSISEVSPDIAFSPEKSDEVCQQYMDPSSNHKEIDAVVSHIFTSKFSEKVTVEHITLHLLQGKILLQIEVSMPPDTMISNAVEMAEDARKEILERIPNVVRVSIQLRLSKNHNTQI